MGSGVAVGLGDSSIVGVADCTVGFAVGLAVDFCVEVAVGRTVGPTVAVGLAVGAGLAVYLFSRWKTRRSASGELEG